MRKPLNRWIAAICAALMLLGCTGCESRQTDPMDQIPESTGGKDVEKAAAADNVFTLNSNSKYSLNPMIATNHSNQLICSLVYENMVELDNNFQVIPKLITGWTCSEDGKSWVFDIDTSHVFHDGTNVTGNDLRLSLEYAIGTDRYSGRFNSIAGVSYSEDKLYVTLAKANRQFVKLLNIPVMKRGTFGDKHPLGSGPYTYNEDGTQLLAFTGYNGYDSLPLDVIYIQEYQTADSIINAFESSLIDVVLNDPSSYTNLGYASTNETRTFATTNMHYLAFNEESTLGRYSNVRQALSYAFDRAYFADSLMKGNAVASTVPMYPTAPDYPTSYANSIGYDMERCQRILDNFGIRDYDEDGKLEFMNGSAQEIEMRLILCSDSSAKAGVARKFAEDMASIGFTIKVEELTWADYCTALEEGNFDIYYGEIKLRNDFDLTELLEVKTKDNADSCLNYTGSTDRSFENYVDSYLAAGSATNVNEYDIERASAFESLCRYLNETGSLITIGFEKQQLITHRGVMKGVDPNMGNPLYDFANWEIDLD